MPGIEGSLFQTSREALGCVLEQDTLSSAKYRFNQGIQDLFHVYLNRFEFHFFAVAYK